MSLKVSNLNENILYYKLFIDGLTQQILAVPKSLIRDMLHTYHNSLRPGGYASLAISIRNQIKIPLRHDNNECHQIMPQMSSNEDIQTKICRIPTPNNTQCQTIHKINYRLFKPTT